MSNSLKIKSYVILDERVKPVPYAPDYRSDGMGYGFIDLKGKPDLVANIVESKGLPGVQRLLRYFASDVSPFFSIGCEKTTGIEESGKASVRGYIEFSFNYPTLANFQNYESLQEGFGECLKSKKLSGLDYVEWRVSPVHVLGVNKGMQSCTLWIKVGGLPTEAIALKKYDKVAVLLAQYFESLEIPHSAQGQIFGVGIGSRSV